MEIWKDIKGYEGYYKVNNLGIVKSYHTQNHKKPIILKPIKSHNGYLQFNLMKNKKRKITLLHRIIANSFIPNLENKPCVNHKDGNKLNNNIDNLEWCTYQENAIHAWKNSLFKNTKKSLEALRQGRLKRILKYDTSKKI